MQGAGRPKKSTSLFDELSVKPPGLKPVDQSGKNGPLSLSGILDFGQHFCPGYFKENIP